MILISDLLFLILILEFLNILDVAFTYKGLRIGLKEGNILFNLSESFSLSFKLIIVPCYFIFIYPLIPLSNLYYLLFYIPYYISIFGLIIVILNNIWCIISFKEDFYGSNR